MSDPINPLHYKGRGMEVIDVIEAFDLNFNLGNVVKYALRAAKKGGIEDLHKGVWHFQREIKALEAEKFCEIAARALRRSGVRRSGGE